MNVPLNLMEPHVRANPYPLYARLRRGPVCQVEPGGMWAVSRYDDVVAVLKDPRRFSSVGLGRSFLPPWLERNPVAHSLVMKDPPDHTRLRALVSRAFSGSALQRLETQVRALAEELAEDVVRQGEVDFVAAFSMRLPVRVLNLFFGLAPELWPRMRQWAEDLLSIPASQPSPERQEEIRQSLGEMEACFRALIASRRAAPGDELVSELLRAEGLTDEELMSFLFSLLPAGFETTAHLLSNSVLVLAQHPREAERVLTQPRLIPPFLEEVLRYESPAQSSLRVVTEEVELGGVRVPRGALVAVLLGSALRDEQRFPEADQFRLERPGPNPLAFGHGIHFCLGAMLARMEARLGLESLGARIAGVQLTQAEVSWSQSYIARGPRVLPVRLLPRTR